MCMKRPTGRATCYVEEARLRRPQTGWLTICLCFQMAGAAAAKGQQNVTRTRPYTSRDHVPATSGGGGHTQVEWHTATFSLSSSCTHTHTHTHTQPSSLASWGRALVQLVAFIFSSPPTRSPRRSYHCGNIRLPSLPSGASESSVWSAILPSRALHLYPPTPAAAVTQPVNLHRPPSPPPTPQPLIFGAFVQHCLMPTDRGWDGWAEVRHGSSHSRAGKALTDGRSSTHTDTHTDTHTHTTRIAFKSLCEHTQSLGIIPQVQNFSDNCFSHLINLHPEEIKRRQKWKRRNGRRKADGVFLLLLPFHVWQNKTRADKWENHVTGYVFRAESSSKIYMDTPPSSLGSLFTRSWKILYMRF